MDNKNVHKFESIKKSRLVKWSRRIGGLANRETLFCRELARFKRKEFDTLDLFVGLLDEALQIVRLGW